RKVRSEAPFSGHAPRPPTAHRPPAPPPPLFATSAPPPFHGYQGVRPRASAPASSGGGDGQRAGRAAGLLGRRAIGPGLAGPGVRTGAGVVVRQSVGDREPRSLRADEEVPSGALLGA